MLGCDSGSGKRPDFGRVELEGTRKGRIHELHVTREPGSNLGFALLRARVDTENVADVAQVGEVPLKESYGHVPYCGSMSTREKAVMAAPVLFR